MNRFCSSKIGLEQSHTECIFSQALFFFCYVVFTSSPVLFPPQCGFLCRSVQRNPLRQFYNIQMWIKSSSPRQEQVPEQTQRCAHRVLTGCSRLGARTGSTTGLVRCTRRWLQKYLSMDLSGRDTTSSMLSSWICCVNICFPLVACYLLSLSLDGFSATESFDGT